MTPLVLNPISLTSCTDGLTPTFESNWDTETEPIQRLPTPEEKMRRQAEAVAADIVPINVTGTGGLSSTFSFKFLCKCGLMDNNAGTFK